MTYPSWVDEEMPPAGPCGICGGPDKRHRVIDAAIGMVMAGDHPAAVAEDYGLSEAFVQRLVDEFGA